MIIRYCVEPQIPAPARTAVQLVQMALSVNRSTAAQLIHDGAVVCRGRTISQSHLRLNIGDVLEIDYAPQPAKPAASKSPKKRRRQVSPQFELVYDDEHIIVVLKPAGLLTVPTPQREKNTLRSQVYHWLARHQAGHLETSAPICVQRLDRGVSGLLVLAKHEAAAEALKTQFAAHRPKRLYAAIVQGRFQPERRTIRSYLTTDPQTLSRYSVTDPSQGELAITHARVREVWQDLTLLSLKLETGRRNQIRVHLAEAGHPIIGDPRYRPREASHPLWPHRRIALHAETLEFTHPMSGEELGFQSPWPQEFRDLRRKTRSKGK